MLTYEAFKQYYWENILRKERHMEIKKVSERFEEKYHEKYDPNQIREHWLEVDKIIKDCNNSIMEMGLPDIVYTSQEDPIHEYCDELIYLNSYIRSADGSVYEWLDYPLWLDFKNGVAEVISQIKAEEITTKNIMGIGGYYDTLVTKGHQWGEKPKKELTFSDFMNLMPEKAGKNDIKARGIQAMKVFQELFQEEYEAKKKELPDSEDPRSYFEDMLVKGQEEHSDYHPFLDLLQITLDVVGFAPGVGEPADFINAVLYAWRGDNVNAVLSASAAIPLIGNFATGGKAMVKGKKTIKAVKSVVVRKGGKKVTKVGGMTVDAVKTINKGSASTKQIDIDSIYHELKTEPDTAFFWSGRTEGVGGAEIAADIAKQKGGVTLESVIESKSISMPEWDFNNPSSMEAWDITSGAYAEQVAGEIRAVIGSSLREGNIWQNVELPRLKNNPNVTKITTIDPKTAIETIIYERK